MIQQKQCSEYKPLLLIGSPTTEKIEIDGKEYFLHKTFSNIKSLKFNDVKNHEKIILGFVLAEDSNNKSKIARMSSYPNKKDISNIDHIKSKDKVQVGKLYRYLENKYYQMNPNVESFADYRFDIDNKANDNAQEKLRSIVQAYLYLQNRYKKQKKIIEYNLGRILELIRIDERRGTNKLLTTASVEEQKVSFLDFFRTKLDNKVEKKYMFNILGEDLDLKGLDDEITLKFLSELYLLKDGKYIFFFRNYSKHIIDFDRSLPIFNSQLHIQIKTKKIS